MRTCNEKNKTDPSTFLKKTKKGFLTFISDTYQLFEKKSEYSYTTKVLQ